MYAQLQGLNAMKKIIFILLFIFSFPHFANAAETINCVDDSGAWKANFTLDGKIVSDIQFIYFDQMNASYPKVRAYVTHLNGKTYYYMNFDDNTYMDFERIDGSPHLKGAFLIYQNPTGEEVIINCEAH